MLMVPTPPDVMIKEVLDMMIESQCTIEITDVLLYFYLCGGCMY